MKKIVFIIAIIASIFISGCINEPITETNNTTANETANPGGTDTSGKNTTITATAGTELPPGEAAVDNKATIDTNAITANAETVTGAENAATEPSFMKILNITTDKEKYTANEIINFSVIIESEKQVNNVSLNVNGIKSRKNTYLLDQTKNINLTKGITMVDFTVTAPTCTHGCGAMYYPDNYNIDAKLSYENTNASFTKVIALY
ncbi:MAG: hypothetical protein CVT90_02810 [Candidatus Altiarchaeales archaeon HGW-Altiarchaeales-3]|nr:MAG: hypothetical protein CVT90_02810 [Candidatus Altiarchaeales archaeon HGW-Altiarchaeales-3]